GWLTLLITTLGAGAAGAIITTYGTQSRDRRNARAEVRARLNHVARLAVNRETPHDQLRSAFREVEDAAFIAAVPQLVVDVYRDAREGGVGVSEARERHEADGAIDTVVTVCAGLARGLFIRVLWHPWLMLPVQRMRARQIRKLLDSGLPPEFRRGIEPLEF